MIGNLQLYKSFYWVAKEGNLSRAANKLFVSQPSLSHAIKKLEEELSILLFHRLAKGVSLTEEGAILYEQVERAFILLEAAENEIAEINKLFKGELRIGSSDSLCKHYLLPHLGEFYTAYPKIKLDLVHGTTPEIVQHVKNGRIDFGIIRLPLVDNSLKIHKAIKVQDCFVAGPKYSYLYNKIISLEELLNLPLILFTKTSSSRIFIEEIVTSKDLKIQPEIELASVDLLIELAKASMGISFVTKKFVQEELDNGKLFEIKLSENIPSRNIGIVFLKNRRLSPSMKTFINNYLNIKLC